MYNSCSQCISRGGEGSQEWIAALFIPVYLCLLLLCCKHCCVSCKRDLSSQDNQKNTPQQAATISSWVAQISNTELTAVRNESEDGSARLFIVTDSPSSLHIADSMQPGMTELSDPPAYKSVIHTAYPTQVSEEHEAKFTSLKEELELAKAENRKLERELLETLQKKIKLSEQVEQWHLSMETMVENPVREMVELRQKSNSSAHLVVHRV